MTEFMPRTKEASREAGLKAAKTRRRKHRKWQVAGKKAAETRKKRKLREVQVKIGERTALKQKQRIHAVSNYLATLKKTSISEDTCIVCGESMKNTLDRHHIDGNRKNNDPSNLVTICASCHRIFDKAVSPEEALLDLKERHKRIHK